MKNLLAIFTLFCFMTMAVSCSLFRSNKTGCPTNGKNIGAEKLVSGDPAAEKAARKAKKFKS
ncbi:MAG: hypothetical protein E6Q24_12710 [Chitinophagaceae bacterium]|jgi:hypothetical protein|nr:hypothetical protein [Sphingobacteriales bacterium]OJW04909.1 MAG: hypothetical protein BGO52_20690 [Sphingobacteriales bacterium 44-61]TXJ25750.1 MAG: hypothetical protein E6Q24_12710 [Chitinophagaceae bacterium]HEX2845817.1 hypothetical protein [Chitinophagaceae bacterium]